MTRMRCGAGVAAVLCAVWAGPSWASAAGTWSIDPTPNPSGSTSAVLSAVSCGPTVCMAVGNYSVGAGTRTLAEAFNGRHWRIVATPSLPGQALLSGISCRTGTSCVAVGYTVSAHNHIAPLVEAWDGRTWTVQAIPKLDGDASLASISCPSTFCLAVGGLTPIGVNAQSRPLALSRSTGGWTVLPTPNPRAENGSWLDGVSCTAANACTAGGNQAYGDVDQSIYALRWAGTEWVTEPQPNPQGQNLNTTHAVSCAGASACVTVGSWVSTGQNTLAEIWDGVGWTRTPTPNPGGNRFAELDGVSCPATAACLAVGDWTSSVSDSTSLTLAEVWDGTAWALSPTPNPTGTEISTLAADACPSQGRCVAVGSFYDGTITRTLAERYGAP